MAASYWIKLYLEILDDSKMAILPDRLWRRVIELFLAAGRYGSQGHLPETQQLAWLFRMNTDDLELDLKQIATTGIIQRNDNGWIVTKFAERQAPVSDAERQRQHRDRMQKHQYYDDVTNSSRNVMEINRLTDTDTETEEEGATTTAATAVSAFQDPTPRRAERLYQRVTGQSSIPSSVSERAIADLTAVLDYYGGRDPPVDDGKRIFARWCSTIGQKGKPYSRLNPGWVGWWLEELAPVPVEMRPKDTKDMTDAEFKQYLQTMGAEHGENRNTLPPG